jgi:hypothetical protein
MRVSPFFSDLEFGFDSGHEGIVAGGVLVFYFVELVDGGDKAFP